MHRHPALCRDLAGQMNEAFLHHLWKFKLFNKHQLLTVDGDEIEILKCGQHNTDAGPDFFNAQIRIGNTTWAGNVEIHLKSGDWNKHRHIKDAAYNNVILHVVYEHDTDVFTKGKTKLPTLELKGRFNPEIFQNYLTLIQSNLSVPCENHIGKVDAITISGWLERMLIERLEIKSAAIADSLKLNKNNWEETLYYQVAKNFGFKTNALPFEMLAKSLPLSVLSKHKSQLNQIEALLFGQAGMLEKKFRAAYPKALKKEYQFLRKKLSLTPINASQWKFLRLRPSNFPTVRLAQFAQFIHGNEQLFSKILAANDTKELLPLFSITATGFWKTHFTFSKPSPVKKKSLGKDAMDILLINTVVPFLYAYGKHHHDESLQLKAMKFLDAIAPEKNSIITMWGKIGITSADAGRTQAMLHLKNEYCNKKKCLFCSVGNKILTQLP